MLVHKCDACGKIFDKAIKHRRYEINTASGPESIGRANAKTLVDICDDCYAAIVEFLDGGNDAIGGSNK